MRTRKRYRTWGVLSVVVAACASPTVCEPVEVEIETFYYMGELLADPDDVVGFDPEAEESCELVAEREFEHYVSRKTWRCTVCVDSGEGGVR